MAEKFSVDDILAELDGRQKETNGGELNKPAGFSLTEELANIERRRGIEEKKPAADKAEIKNRNSESLKLQKPQQNKKIDVKPKGNDIDMLSVTQILDDKRLRKPSPAKNYEIKTPPEKIKPKIQKANENPEWENPPERVKANNTPKSTFGETPKGARDKTLSVTQILEDKHLKQSEKLGVTQILDGTEMQRRVKETPHRPEYEKPKKPAANKPYRDENIDNKNKSVKSKKAEIIYEKARVLPKPVIEEYIESEQDLQKKRDLTILERDIALENPNELIDGINPYEIIKNVNEENEKKYTSDEKPSEMSGDTQGIAGDDLKELAARSADEIASGYTTAEFGVKQYSPSESKQAEMTKVIPPLEKAKRSNTALLESLNKAIREKRDSGKKHYTSQHEKHNTSQNSTEQNGEDKKLPTNALNIDYKKQILDTASMPLNNLTEQRFSELNMKRKRKIRDFVLEDIDTEELDPDYYDTEEEKTDFESYDSSGQIWNDLCESHKGLKARFIILLIITGFTAFLTLMNDLQQNMAFNLFGMDILFLDKRYDSTGFLYLNLILGVIGIASCGTVITGGISRLFKGKSDCDSICGVPAVLSLICIIPQLQNTDYIQRSRANIFIAAALTALLFNTMGKLLMVVRAKRNFRFISGDKSKYYAELIQDQEMAQAFTRSAVRNLPVLAVMRKTEFLTDFLKNSYCTDAADKINRFLTPIGLGVSFLIGILAYFIPVGSEEMRNNIYWALTAGCGMITVLSPFSMMFIVNLPLSRAARGLEKTDSVVMGYDSAAEFSDTNSVLVDASLLFPAGSVAFRNIKRCQQSSALGSYAIDEAIITAASLAIKSGSILTYMFYDMIAGKDELLYKVDNCIYEVNMGISGWIGSKRIMLGNRDQMKHHGIKVPDIKKERKYCSENGDVVYLAVGGETVSMFFIEILPNNEIYRAMRELTENGVSVIVKTKDSLVTVNKLADVFDIPPEMVRILPFDMHGVFDECTKYTSRGRSAIACNGTFTSFAGALTASKKIMRDISVSLWLTYLGLFIAAVLGILFMIFVMPQMFTSTNVILYNLILFILTACVQRFRKYG